MRGWVVYLFLRAAITNCHRLGDGLRQHKFICLLFWRLEIWNQCISRVMLLLRSRLESSLAYFYFCWLLAISGSPWFVDASLKSLLLLPHGILSICLCLSSHGILLSTCLCPNFLLLIRTPVTGIGLTLNQYDLIEYIWKVQLYLQIRSQSQELGVRTYLLGYTILPTTDSKK